MGTEVVLQLRFEFHLASPFSNLEWEREVMDSTNSFFANSLSFPYCPMETAMMIMVMSPLIKSFRSIGFISHSPFVRLGDNLERMNAKEAASYSNFQEATRKPKRSQRLLMRPVLS